VATGWHQGIPDSIAREDVEQAIIDFDRGVEHDFGPSTTYDLLFQGRRYPPKAILGLGARRVAGRTLGPNEFSGGQDSRCFKVLRDLGFEIVEKPERREDTVKKIPGIRKGLETILAQYSKARTEAFAAHPIREAFEGLKVALRESAPVARRAASGQPIKVEWGVGKGNWASVPWIALMDTHETDTTQRGVYCVFLFRHDSTGVYLTFNQGVTQFRRKPGLGNVREAIHARAQELRKYCGNLDGNGFLMDDAIDLRSDAGLATDYESSTIAYRLYQASEVPTDDQLLADVEAVLSVYDRYLVDKPQLVPQVPGRQPNSWIFQSNPEVYDLMAAVSALRGLHFRTRQHADEIRVGDVVYLWESGQQAGVIAVSEVVEGPNMMSDDPAEGAFWKAPEMDAAQERSVRLEIKHVLPQRVLRRDLQKHPLLSGIQIIRSPQGTNFPLKPEEASALASMIAPAIVFEARVSVGALVDAIARLGYVFEPWQVAAYVTALRTKPFVILAGVSGTGKSKLPGLVAALTGGRAELLPVRPDWTDSSEVLGYVGLEQAFHVGPLLRFARDAWRDPKQHFVCIVDEMNLARVEHYFAEVLSRIEDRHRHPAGGYESGPLWAGQTVAARDADDWMKVGLPPNLAIVGTVNMDESAHGFSRKVLDRAFTLELSDVDLNRWGQAATTSRSIAPWPVSAWFPRATRLGELQGLTGDEQSLVERTIETLTTVNVFLSQAQLQVGYRTRDEVALFVLHANDLAPLFVTTGGVAVDPLDLALHMKVLPRLAGGSNAIRSVILRLLSWSLDGQPADPDADSRDVLQSWQHQGRPASLPTARYPRTAARLCLMLERQENEGFTSYWL
jgi:hypothetical protein